MTTKIDARSLRRTGRNSQLNIKVREEFRQLVYQLAKKEGCTINSLAEKAIMDYTKSKDDKRERERETKICQACQQIRQILNQRENNSHF